MTAWILLLVGWALVLLAWSGFVPAWYYTEVLAIGVVVIVVSTVMSIRGLR